IRYAPTTIPPTQIRKVTRSKSPAASVIVFSAGRYPQRNEAGSDRSEAASGGGTPPQWSRVQLGEYPTQRRDLGLVETGRQQAPGLLGGSLGGVAQPPPAGLGKGCPRSPGISLI